MSSNRLIAGSTESETSEISESKKVLSPNTTGVNSPLSGDLNSPLSGNFNSPLSGNINSPSGTVNSPLPENFNPLFIDINSPRSEDPVSPKTSNECGGYDGSYVDLPASSLPASSNDDRVYNSYAPLRPTSISAPSLKALSENKESIYQLNCFHPSQTEDKKRLPLTINIPDSKLYFMHKKPVDLNYYLNSYVFTSEPYGVYHINKKAGMIPLKIKNSTHFKDVIDSMLLHPNHYIQLIRSYTDIAMDLFKIIEEYLMIHPLSPLEDQLSPKELRKFISLIPNSLAALSPRFGIDTGSSFINRPYCSSGTGIPELGPYYELLTGKGLTAINIQYMRIKKNLLPDEKSETFFMAFKRWAGNLNITREKLDIFIEDETFFPSDIPEWKAFKDFYYRSNMIFLKREQYDACQLKFTPEGLGTISEDNIQHLFDEKEPSSNGRRIADSTNKSGYTEIHGEDTVIYAFVEDQGVSKLLIAKDTLGQFHHNSFAAANEKEGVGVITAGTMKIKHGKIVELTNQSGHYKPSQKRFNKLLKYLIANNATSDLELIKITVKTVYWEQEKNGKVKMKTGTRDIIKKGKEEIQAYLKEIQEVSKEARTEFSSKLIQLRNRRKGSGASTPISSPSISSLQRAFSTSFLESSSTSELESSTTLLKSSSVVSESSSVLPRSSTSSNLSRLKIFPREKTLHKNSVDELEMPSLIRVGSGEFLDSPSTTSLSFSNQFDPSPSPVNESSIHGSPILCSSAQLPPSHNVFSPSSHIASPSSSSSRSNSSHNVFSPSSHVTSPSLSSSARSQSSRDVFSPSSHVSSPFSRSIKSHSSNNVFTPSTDNKPFSPSTRVPLCLRGHDSVDYSQFIPKAESKPKQSISDRIHNSKIFRWFKEKTSEKSAQNETIASLKQK